MEAWMQYNTEWLYSFIGTSIVILIFSVLIHFFRKYPPSKKRAAAVSLGSSLCKSIFLLMIGWGISSNIAFFRRPKYLLHDYRSHDAFDSILESLAISEIDTSKHLDLTKKSENTDGLEVFYTSDEPFLVEVKGLKTLLFCPARPLKLGKAGVIPLSQFQWSRSEFRCLALIPTKAFKIYVGKRKPPQLDKLSYEK